MGLTQAQIASDHAFIFSDLLLSGANETVIREIAGSKTQDVSFAVIRAEQLTRDEIEGSGFELEYRFSIYAQISNIGELVQGDILIFPSGERLRVFRLAPGPSQTVTRMELGDEFQAGEDL